MWKRVRICRKCTHGGKLVIATHQYKVDERWYDVCKECWEAFIEDMYRSRQLEYPGDVQKADCCGGP
jgi:superfamily II helicase